MREIPQDDPPGKTISRGKQPMSPNEKHPLSPFFRLCYVVFRDRHSAIPVRAVEKLFFFDFGFDFPRNDDILYTILDVGY